MSDVLDSLLDNSTENLIYEDENVVLAPLLEELDLIYNEDILSFCRSVLLKAEPAFWTAPFGPPGQDLPPDECKDGGNILHVQRVVRACVYLAYSQELEIDELDYVIAAALLHSVTKVSATDDGYSWDLFHPYTVGPFVFACRLEDDSKAKEGQSTSLWLEEDEIATIMRIIRCQKGIWSIVPETQPLDTVEWILHQADYMVSSIHRILDGQQVELWRWIGPKRTKDD